MKSFDFDELDRAVNEALGTTPVVNEENEKPTTAKVAVEKSPKAVDTPEPTKEPADLEDAAKATTSSSATEDATPTVVLRSPASRRASGRFMDVVHPSSDMKQATAPMRVGRQGTTIVPRGGMEDAVPEEPQATKSKVEIADEAIETELSITEPLFTPKAQVDMADIESTETESEVAETSLVEEENAAPLDSDSWSGHYEMGEDTESEGMQALDAALESPFLDHAQVEKRPLGAFSAPDNTPEETGETEVKSDVSESKDKSEIVQGSSGEVEAYADGTESTSSDKPIDAEPGAIDGDASQSAPLVDLDAALAEELQGDILSVESTPEPAPEVRANETTDTPLAVTSPSPARPVQGDIPRQYREEPQQVSEDIAPIFDTETYHQPLKHVPKKKSGWAAVFWILGLIALGVAVGVIFYLFDPLNLL